MSKTTTKMELVPAEKLVPYVNNARTHSAEQITKLRSSLREFGFVNPIIIDRNFNVLAGHGRLLAAKEEKISEVPCVSKVGDIWTLGKHKIICGDSTLPETYQKLLGETKNDDLNDKEGYEFLKKAFECFKVGAGA